MPIITNREAAILGLLSERPMYAYEIEKIIEERNMRYWTEISFSTLYYELKKLKKKGLVTSETTISSKNIAKKIYSINEQGTQVLKEKITSILSNVEKIIWQIDLGMANISLLSKTETIEAFSHYIQSIHESIVRYQELLDYLSTHAYPDSDLALAQRPLLHLEAEKKWAEEYVEGIKHGTKTNWNDKNQR